MVSGKPIYGETSEAGTYATQAVFVDERFFRHFVNGSEVVLHALAAIITADGFVPLYTEARKTTTVGSYDDIVVCRHNLEIPTVAPELADGTLRTTFTEEEGGVLLVRVELWRINHPGQHLLAVGGLHPAGFHLTHLQLVVNLLVFCGQLHCFCKSVAVACTVYGIDFVAHAHGVAFGDNLVSAKGKRSIVVHAVGELGKLVVSGKVDVVNLCLAMPYTDEVDALGIFVPQEGVHVRFESFAYKTFLAGLEVHDKQAVQVGFVAVTFHALPGDVFAVGRVLGIRIISLVFFRDVFGFLGGKVVDINVGVGGNGIRQSGFLTACIGYLIRKRAPCQLLDTAPGLHRAFVWLSLKNISDIADGIAVEISNKRMGSSSHPFIPMLVHQVGNDDAGGFRKVRMFVCRTLHGLYLGNEKEFLAVGREREPFDVSLVLSQLLASAAVGIHFPYLAAAAFVAEEGKLLAVLEPCGLSFLPGVMRYLGIATTVGIHDEDFAVTLVLGHAVIGYRVGNLLFVGRYGYTADTSHRPECLGCHTLSFNLDVRPLDERCCVLLLSGIFCSSAGGQCHGC